MFYSTPCDDAFGKRWQPSWIANPRDDLRCHLDDRCRNESTQVKSEQFDKCCVCNSCALWEGSEIQLFIEYVSVLGKSLIVPDQAFNNTEVYELKHNNGEMTSIPSNLCNWDLDTSLTAAYAQDFESVKKIWGNIVKINFRNNKISTLPNLSCLEKLDELNLNDNFLTYISNTSFTSLTNLRKIYFSGNLIQNIDPGIISAVQLNLFEADFSYNKMSKLDVSNMMSLYPFCNVGFETNEITELVNEDNFTLDMDKNYGPGFVSFKDNNIETFPDFKTLLNLDNIAQMGKLISSGFDYRDIPLMCDCHLEPFMSLTEDVIATLWHDYFKVKCAGPPDLKGKIVSEVDPERLICKLPADSNCQTPTCTCTDKPKSNTMQVNCSNDDQNKEFLKTLPTFPKSTLSQFISVDISGHKITNISNITHLSNITMLNASGNNLLEISNNVARALENATVDISNNLNLRHLPQAFQYCNVCNMYMSNLEIDCDCNSLWIETWLKSKKCIKKEHMFFCRLPDGKLKSALTFRSSDIDCANYNHYPTDIIAGLTVFIIFITTTGIMIYVFRYDLIISYVRLKQRDRSKVQFQYSYDVFLSFNEDDENVAKWVDGTLEDYLVAEGYRVFQAGHDVSFGAERNSETLEAINKTCNFLLILSDSYLDQGNEEIRPWTENEWKYGWHNFLRDKYKNLIIINFDHISSFDVDQPQIKAFLRVGSTIDFKNHDRNIMEAICKKLGEPYNPQMNDVKGIENKKPKPLDFTRFPQNTTLRQESSNKTAEEILEQLNVMKYLQNPLDTDKDQQKAFLRNKVDCQKVEGISHHPQRPFQCYYENRSLKKTPHIPLFKKDCHQSRSPIHSTNKLKKLSDIYKRRESTVKSPKQEKSYSRSERDTESIGSISNISSCKSNILNHSNDTRNDELDNFEDNTFQLYMSMTNSENNSDYMDNKSDRGLRESANNDTNSLRGSANNDTNSLRGSSNADTNSLSGSSNTDTKSLSVSANNDTYSLGGSANNDTRSLGGSANNDTQSLGGSANNDTRSLGGSANIFTSIGGSTVSFNSETFSNNSMVEISNA